MADDACPRNMGSAHDGPTMTSCSADADDEPSLASSLFLFERRVVLDIAPGNPRAVVVLEAVFRSSLEPPDTPPPRADTL